MVNPFDRKMEKTEAESVDDMMLAKRKDSTSEKVTVFITLFVNQ